MFKLLHKFAKDSKGATAIEYGLIAALVAVAAIGAMSALGTNISEIFTDAGAELDAASASGNVDGSTQ